MVPVNTQDGTFQYPGWSLSTPRMVPLNTQDGASQNPGWCLSEPRMVTIVNTQDRTSLDVAADSFWESRFERAFFDLRVSHSRLESAIPIAVLLPEA